MAEFGNGKRGRDGPVEFSEATKRFKETDFIFFDVLDDDDIDPNGDLADVIKSLEEEIGSAPVTEEEVDGPPPQLDLGYLLEASDDELGLPPVVVSVDGGDAPEAVGGSPETVGFDRIWGFEDDVAGAAGPYGGLEFGMPAVFVPSVRLISTPVFLLFLPQDLAEMAPDLNGVTQDRKWDYSTPGSGGYNIPNITMGDPKNQRIKVITIGAGFSGILMAYQIQKLCKNVDHKIYEKNEDIGGTWLENRYPGCACDVPSHAYTMNFALNPDWPRFFSYSPDIWSYLDKICRCFDLRKYMTFNTEVVEARWYDDIGKWKVKLRQTQHSGAAEIEDECDILLYATGILNDFKWPNIEGIETFKGKVVHTARWPKEYQEEQWKQDSIAVIGSGASSIQTVPKMQPHVKHMDIFVRTAVWFVQIANNYGQNHEYSKEEKEKFRKNPEELVKHAKSIEDQINGLWGTFYTGSEAQAKAQDMFKKRMAEFIKDERLLEGFTPKWEVGCRRITPGDPYMHAIQGENVDVHFTPVSKITEHGVIGGDGLERKVDTIVCATGFDVTYKPRFPVIGKNGVNLYEKWRDAPEGYLGLGVPDMPNFMIFIGPTWPVENGSVAGPLLTVSEYAVEMIRKMQYENIKSLVPRQDITDAFNEHSQEWIKHTVWKDSCRSWYKNNETGRVNAIWPGSSLHYAELISKPRWEDYEIAYHYKNPFAFLGMGRCIANVIPGSDYSPYIQVDNIDPKWLKFVQGSEERAEESIAERASKRRRKDSVVE